jgi:hypothetical protein
MRAEGWSRREVLVRLTATVGTALAAARGEAWAAPGGGPGPGGPPRDREARRRWALARMDEMAQERLRCRERLRVPRQVQECEREFERRHRAYNEIYLEAVRE